MKFIFLIAAFNAFFFTVLLIQKKPRRYHDNLLIAWLVYLGLFIGIYSFYSHELFTHFRILSNSLLSLFMLHGPFLYFYSASIVSDRKLRMPHDLVHLAPFILFNLYIVYSFFDPGFSQRLNIEMIRSGFTPPSLYLAFLILTVLSGPFYFILTLRLFRELDINIFNNYSSSVNVNPGWLRMLIIVFGIVWTILMAVTVIHHVFNMFSMVFCTDGLFLSLSVFVILIGYFGLKQNVIFSSGDIIVESTSGKVRSKYAGSRLTEKDSREYAARLLNYMTEKEPFLNPDLTLSILADETGIPPHHLSQVINEQFNKNFFDFVNKYRVDSFIKKLTDPASSNFSLLGIAFESGFNSKSAFNRVFRQVTGKTPSEFRRST